MPATTTNNTKKKSDITLNDKARMGAWQMAMPDFHAWDEAMLDNPQLKDYLACYGLDKCFESKDLNYQAGYRDSGGERIFLQYFKQVDEHAEVVLVVHGYTDHAGLFTKVIKHLFTEGYSVCIFDFPGHGLSSGERASIKSFDHYRAVLNDSFNFFQNLCQKPLHIVAQSLGGGMTMHWLLADKTAGMNLGNVVLLAPLVRPRAWKQANWSYRFLNKVADSIPRGISRNSEDESFTQFARFGDPVQHDRLPAEWVGSMIEWVKHFETLAGNDFPLTVIQGDRDETVEWEFNAPHIQEKFPNTILHMVVGAGHHLAGESDRLQEYIFSYIDAGLKRV